MVKKFAVFLAALFMTILTAVPCWAIKFSQPVKLGEAAWNQVQGGFTFSGAKRNDGKAWTDYKGKRTDRYTEGVVIFGTGDMALYCHYGDLENFKYGGKNIQNTVGQLCLANHIYCIATDSGYVFYVIYVDYTGGGFSIIGKTPEGNFVKYIDGNQISQTYFGHRNAAFGRGGAEDNFGITVSGDAIIVPYFESRDENQAFRFRWDENAQWFGVELVKF